MVHCLFTNNTNGNKLSILCQVSNIHGLAGDSTPRQDFSSVEMLAFSHQIIIVLKRWTVDVKKKIKKTKTPDDVIATWIKQTGE